MTEINRAGLRLIAADIEEAVQAVAKKHGIAVRRGAASFVPGQSFTLKLEGGVIEEDGTVLDRMAVDFKSYAPLVGLATTDLGRCFSTGYGRTERTFKIVGIKPRSRQCVIAESAQDGRRFKFDPKTVAALLAGKGCGQEGLTD